MGYLDPQTFTYGVGDITRRLGQDLRPCGAPTSERWRCNHIAGLIADHGFPAPLPLPGADGGAIKPRARWTRASVDKWFHDRDPDGTAAVDAAAMRDAADVMDARAADLGRAIAGTDLRMVDGGRA